MSRSSRNYSVKSNKSIFQVLVLVLALGLITYGCMKLLNRYSVLHGGVPKPDSVSIVTLDHPSEQPVPSNYSVPSEQPLAINLPTIEASGYIQKVGVDKTNHVVAPSNINMVGWNVDSVKPGDIGLSIIDGHVNGLYGKGVFYKLVGLKTGDKFNVTFGDHSSRNFQVKRVNKVSVSESPSYLFAHYTAYPRQLNLITCGEKYVAGNKSYDGRVNVVAEGI